MAEQAVTISVKEAARWLHISKGLAYEAVHRGEIPSIRVGKRFLVPRIALLRMLEGAGARRAVEGIGNKLQGQADSDSDS